MKFTKSGLDNLKKEYQDLIIQRKAAVLDLTKARELGDLSENGYYKASKAKLGHIDSRLRRIKYDIGRADVIEAKGTDHVEIGTRVTVESLGKAMEYDIVGGYETSPIEGKISNISPLGKALLGKKVGEKVSIHAPKGEITFTIVAISLSK